MEMFDTDDVKRGNRQHFVVVRDDPDLLEVVSELLCSANYSVSAMQFMPDTWEHIVARDPSLLLVDLTPLRPKQFDLMERVHAQTATNQIPLLVTSTAPDLAGTSA